MNVTAPVPLAAASLVLGARRAADGGCLLFLAHRGRGRPDRAGCGGDAAARCCRAAWDQKDAFRQSHGARRKTSARPLLRLCGFGTEQS